MATKPKTTKLTEHRPPSAIASDTKARRAWLAARADAVRVDAEVNGVAGITTKVLEH